MTETITYQGKMKAKKIKKMRVNHNERLIGFRVSPKHHELLAEMGASFGASPSGAAKRMVVDQLEHNPLMDERMSK